MRPSERPPRNDLIALLPKANGNIGGVVVRPGEMQAITYGADRVQREFSSVVAALLGRPATSLLYFPEGKDKLTPDSEREVKRVFAEIAARQYPEFSSSVTPTRLATPSSTTTSRVNERSACETI